MPSTGASISRRPSSSDRAFATAAASKDFAQADPDMGEIGLNVILLALRLGVPRAAADEGIKPPSRFLQCEFNLTDNLRIRSHGFF